MNNQRSNILKKRSAAMTEYIIILALVAIGSIAVFNIFGDQIRSVIGASAQQLAGEKVNPTKQTDNVEDAISKGMSEF